MEIEKRKCRVAPFSLGLSHEGSFLISRSGGACLSQTLQINLGFVSSLLDNIEVVV